MALVEKVISASFKRMMHFYQHILQAEVLDQTDQYACLKLGCTTVELYHGQAESKRIAIELDSVEKMKSILKVAEVSKPMTLESYSGDKQVFVAQILDVYGNIIQLTYYQYLPEIIKIA